MKIVSGEESSALIGNLIPTANYDVSVAASTNAGTGEFSEAISLKCKKTMNVITKIFHKIMKRSQLFFFHPIT